MKLRTGPINVIWNDGRQASDQSHMLLDLVKDTWTWGLRVALYNLAYILRYRLGLID